MTRWIVVILFYYIVIISTFAASYKQLVHTLEQDKISHVIYVTLDGVRWQDVFRNQNVFIKFKNNALIGKFYGMPRSRTTMEAASVPLSLPSYQSQMAGEVQDCSNNDCGRIRAVTVAENILEKMHLHKKEAVVFSSWPKIAFAAEHIDGKLHTNTGNVPGIDPITELPDAMMSKLNQEQIADHPIDYLHRYDKYTVQQAMHYFKKFEPIFMWISLCDGDDAAEQGNLKKYNEALAYYDDFIDQLFETLRTLKLEKQTLVIITTDHGRGNGEFWSKSGPEFPESKQTWAFVMNGTLKPLSIDGKIRHYNTLSFRPTIESILGISE